MENEIHDGSVAGAGEAIAGLLERDPSILNDGGEPSNEELADEPETEEVEAQPDEGDEEAEAEDESEDEAPEEDDGDDPLVEGVPLPGGDTTTLPLSEVLRGYSRTEDYKQKTADLAREREKLNGEMQGLQSERQQLAERLNQNLAIIPQLDPPDPSLAEEDPAEYIRQKAHYDATIGKRQAAERELQALQAKYQEEERQKSHQRLISEQQKLLQAWPELAGENADKLKTHLRTGLMDHYGITEDEINGTIDHRMFLLAKDALAFRAQQAAKGDVSKKLARKPRVIKTKGKESKGYVQRKAKQTKLDKFKKTGSVEDAAAIFNDMDL